MPAAAPANASSSTRAGLNSAAVQALAGLGAACERLVGPGQDIEWAFSAGTPWLAAVAAHHDLSRAGKGRTCAAVAAPDGNTFLRYRTSVRTPTWPVGVRADTQPDQRGQFGSRRGMVRGMK